MHTYLNSTAEARQIKHIVVEVVSLFWWFLFARSICDLNTHLNTRPENPRNTRKNNIIYAIPLLSPLFEVCFLKKNVIIYWQQIRACLRRGAITLYTLLRIIYNTQFFFSFAVVSVNGCVRVCVAASCEMCTSAIIILLYFYSLQLYRG